MFLWWGNLVSKHHELVLTGQVGTIKMVIRRLNRVYTHGNWVYFPACHNWRWTSVYLESKDREPSRTGIASLIRQLGFFPLNSIIAERQKAILTNLLDKVQLFFLWNLPGCHNINSCSIDSSGPLNWPNGHAFQWPGVKHQKICYTLHQPCTHGPDALVVTLLFAKLARQPSCHNISSYSSPQTMGYSRPIFVLPWVFL